MRGKLPDTKRTHESEGQTLSGQDREGGTRGEGEMDIRSNKSVECNGEGVGKKTRRSREQAWSRSPGKHSQLTDLSPR